MAEQYDKVSHASLNGLYVKAQELDRGQNNGSAPSALPPGVFADEMTHASTHASDAQTRASESSDAATHESTHASDAQTHETGGERG